jgi:hypothetical protein
MMCQHRCRDTGLPCKRGAVWRCPRCDTQCCSGHAHVHRDIHLINDGIKKVIEGKK